MSASPMKWLKLAEELLEALPERPDDADPEEERLEWLLHERVAGIVRAASLRPDGVKKSDCSDWPRVLAGRLVTGWWTQAQLAHVVGRAVRTLRRWESKGLPVFGEGKSLRYPMPHAMRWCLAYDALKARHGRIVWLPLTIALGEQARTGAYLTSGRQLRVRD